jgi:hypothetical protein
MSFLFCDFWRKNQYISLKKEKVNFVKKVWYVPKMSWKITLSLSYSNHYIESPLALVSYTCPPPSHRYQCGIHYRCLRTLKTPKTKMNGISLLLISWKRGVLICGSDQSCKKVTKNFVHFILNIIYFVLIHIACNFIVTSVFYLIIF